MCLFQLLGRFEDQVDAISTLVIDAAAAHRFGEVHDHGPWHSRQIAQIALCPFAHHLADGKRDETLGKSSTIELNVPTNRALIAICNFFLSPPSVFAVFPSGGTGILAGYGFSNANRICSRFRSRDEGRHFVAPSPSLCSRGSLATPRRELRIDREPARANLHTDRPRSNCSDNDHDGNINCLSVRYARCCYRLAGCTSPRTPKRRPIQAQHGLVRFGVAHHSPP